jgi:hypothetical protein
MYCAKTLCVYTDFTYKLLQRRIRVQMEAAIAHDCTVFTSYLVDALLRFTQWFLARLTSGH